MPISQVERIHKAPSKGSDSAAGSSTKLRTMTQAEAKAWNETLNDEAILNYEFIDLDQPFEYPFKDQDAVWVRTKEDNWYLGKVTGRVVRVGQTHHRKNGFYYPVNFGSKSNLRKYFAPTNGEIKPDTELVRQLLRNEGWIDDDDDIMTDSSGSTYIDKL